MEGRTGARAERRVHLRRQSSPRKHPNIAGRRGSRTTKAARMHAHQPAVHTPLSDTRAMAQRIAPVKNVAYRNIGFTRGRALPPQSGRARRGQEQPREAPPPTASDPDNVRALRAACATMALTLSTAKRTSLTSRQQTTRKSIVARSCPRCRPACGRACAPVVCPELGCATRCLPKLLYVTGRGVGLECVPPPAGPP